MNRIFLIGFMGVGKTSLGKKIARKLDYEFIDTDKEIEKKTKLSIHEIFTKLGEKTFRQLEKETITKLFTKNNVVISTGGGLPCHNNLIKKILENGLVINFHLDKDTLINRLKKSKNNRPLIQSKNNIELVQYVKEILNDRNNYYKKAHLSFDTKNINSEKLHKIINKIKNYIKQ